MTKPDEHGIPAFDAMTQSADFFRKIWGSMPSSLAGMPGIVMPTLSIEEIDKQIADMKSVEGWLDMNRNMLRSAIQALEVQRATITTLRAMGETFGARPASSAADNAAANDTSSGSASSDDVTAPYADAFKAMGADPAAWWDVLQGQFNQAVQSVMDQQAPAPSGEKKPASRKTTAAGKKVATGSVPKKAVLKKRPAKK
jgi:hypothetical protein